MEDGMLTNNQLGASSKRPTQQTKMEIAHPIQFTHVQEIQVKFKS